MATEREPRPVGADDIPPPPGAGGSPPPPPQPVTTSAPAPPPAPASGSEAAAPAEESRREFVGTGVFWSLVLGSLVALILVIFVLQNSEQIGVEFLGWDWRMSLAGIVLLALLAGVVLDEVVGLVYRRRRRRRLAEREELKRLQSS